MRNELIQDIIGKEWGMFSSVHNLGGKASCQTMPETFSLMRRSQLDAWDEPTLRSYLADIDAALAEGRNLMTEKYAWMMESEHPEDFAAVRHALPPVDPEAMRIVEAIVAVNMRWKAEVDARYPLLARQGRPLRAESDSDGCTSFETYLKGELRTYSVNTLRLLKDWTEDCLRRGVNGAELNLLSQMRGYGFAGLADAEAALARASTPA